MSKVEVGWRRVIEHPWAIRRRARGGSEDVTPCNWYIGRPPVSQQVKDALREKQRTFDLFFRPASISSVASYDPDIHDIMTIQPFLCRIVISPV